MAPYILGKLWILVVITRIGRPNDGFFDSVGAFEWSQRRVMRRHERNIGGTMSLWSMNWQCKDMFRDCNGLPFAAELAMKKKKKKEEECFYWEMHSIVMHKLGSKHGGR
eukprot:1089441_1